MIVETYRVYTVILIKNIVVQRSTTVAYIYNSHSLKYSFPAF